MNAHSPDLAKTLPVNLEAEQGLLGTILIQPESVGAVAGILRPEHFSEILHQQIYEVCLTMSAAGRRPSPITIKDYLPADLKIGDMSIPAYLAHLAGSAMPGMAGGFASAIIDLSTRRQLIGIGEDIQALAFDTPAGEPPKVQIEDAIERLSKLSSAGLRASMRQSTAGAAAKDVLASIESDEAIDPPISTGLSDLDRIIGGYRRGNLVILAARPAMGKSTLAGSSALKVAAAGHGVLFFSKEMTKEQLVSRLLADLAYRSTEPVTYEAILNRDVRDAERRGLIRDAAERLKGLPFIVDPQPGMTMAEIAMRTRRVAESMERKGIRLGLVIIDHLGKIKAPGRDQGNRNLELGEMTGAAANLSKDVDAALMLLCQLNRQVEQRDNKRPTIADLRESGRIEEDADCVVTLYREAYYLAKTHEDDPAKEDARAQKLAGCVHDLEAIVVKNRHGAEGVARLWMHPGTASVRDRDWR